jgi:saccharopine dehydrogenase (NAD+, L-lysine forming)
MDILLVGAGGVGSAFASIAARRPFFESLVVADIDEGRARTVVDRIGDPRLRAARIDASDRAAVAEVARTNGCDVVMNAADPRFVMPIFDATFEIGATYLDMAMSLEERHPTAPYEQVGKEIGWEQWAAAPRWEERGLLALVGMGVEPGLADIFARYAADHLFSAVDQIGVRDGANLVIEGYDFAPTFNVATTIDECLAPPYIWEKDRGWFCTEPFSEPETFVFPEGIGPLECVNVAHEEVVLVPRWVDATRVTFKYGLGDEFIDVLRVIHKLGMESMEKIRVGAVEVAPLDVVAACLPDPAGLGDRMSGTTCAGTWVTGTGIDGAPREVYLYHVVDNAESMARDASQAVVWQTAIHPVVALELLAGGVWSGVGVLGPEAFDAVPFLDLLAGDYASPWGIEERTSGLPGEPARG